MLKSKDPSYGLSLGAKGYSSFASGDSSKALGPSMKPSTLNSFTEKFWAVELWAGDCLTAAKSITL